MIIGLAVVWMASAPSPAWGQWTGGPTGPIYYNGGNVGIGTTAPQYKLDVVGVIRASNGTVFTQIVPFSGAIGYIGNVSNHPVGLMANNTEYLRINSSGGGWWTGGNVGIGTNSPQYKLAVNGTIGAKEVIVTNLGWSDYVFRPGYRLRPLSEVGAYIRAHHHLPDIPSAAEVKQQGVSLGEMQAKLLAKIEELTLHMIQADERNNRLEQQNRELQDRIARLEARGGKP